MQLEASLDFDGEAHGQEVSPLAQRRLGGYDGACGVGRPGRPRERRARGCLLKHCGGRHIRELPMLSAKARRCAADIVRVLGQPMDSIGSVVDAAGRTTMLVDSCREIFNRFQDECIEVELLPDSLLSRADVNAAKDVLSDFRLALEAELKRVV
jgi:hypothetical protein